MMPNQATLPDPTTTSQPRRPCTGASPGAICKAASLVAAIESAKGSLDPHNCLHIFERGEGIDILIEAGSPASIER